MKRVQIYFLLLSMVIFSCSKSTQINQYIKDPNIEIPYKINIEEAIKNHKEVPLSFFVEDIEYIPLKIDDHYFKTFDVIGYDEEDEVFLLGDIYNLFMVNREGRVINRIGKVGQGPSEYLQISTTTMDPVHKMVYVYATYSNAVLKYNYQGKFIKNMFSLLDSDKFTACLIYNDNNFIGISESYFFRLNDAMDILYGFSIMDTTGQMLDITPAPYTRIKDPTENRLVQFMTGIKQTKFQDHYLLVPTIGKVDTIYTVHHTKIEPYVILDHGNKVPTIEKLWIADNDERQRGIYHSYFILNSAFETEHYFFISMNHKKQQYTLFYDKKTGDVFSIKYNNYGMSEEFKNKYDENVAKWEYGFYNDIDGGIDTFPRLISSKGGYWVSYISASNMIELLTNDYFEGRKGIGDEGKKEKLKKIVCQLQEDDNEVLILMKLKENI